MPGTVHGPELLSIRKRILCKYSGLEAFPSGATEGQYCHSVGFLCASTSVQNPFVLQALHFLASSLHLLFVCTITLFG